MKFKGTFINWPLEANTIRGHSISNTFGMVRKNADGSERPHQGWDFSAHAGTEFYSISEGAVSYISDRGALGLMLVVSIGGSGYYAAYCHLSEVFVEAGDRVDIGQSLGKTGESGNAYGMDKSQQHLHFEIRTAPITGKGLTGRISPLDVFGRCPLHEVIYT
jgi:murein DD-endopeptidase MepM/ murein hydrolase activator NlpD